MPPDLYDVTDAELAVLQTLWEHGAATIWATHVDTTRQAPPTNGQVDEVHDREEQETQHP